MCIRDRHPTIAIINNIDNDHLDYYKTIENIQAAFQQFIGLLPQDGWLFACTDDPRVRQLFAPFPGNKISYGMASADYMPADIRYDHDGCPSYDLTFRGKTLGRIQLHVQGTHQIIDSMAAAAVALHPVSYTHLDVYKRQTAVRAGPRRAAQDLR